MVTVFLKVPGNTTTMNKIFEGPLKMIRLILDWGIVINSHSPTCFETQNNSCPRFICIWIFDPCWILLAQSALQCPSFVLSSHMPFASGRRINIILLRQGDSMEKDMKMKFEVFIFKNAMDTGPVNRIRVTQEHLFHHVLAVYLNMSNIWSLLYSLPLSGVWS